MSLERGPLRRRAVSLAARRHRGLEVVLGLLCWTLAIVAGIAAYVVFNAPVAPVVIAWYALESLTVVLHNRAPRRAAILAYAIPRAVGTAVALAVSALARLPWDQTIALAYVVLLVLEGLYCLLLRVHGGELAANHESQAPPGHPGARVPVWREMVSGAGRVALAWLFVVILPLTLYAHGARQVVFDGRFYLDQVERLGLYEQALDPVGQLLVDAARGQGRDVRRAIALLSPDDVRLAAQLAMPQEWTVAFAEQVMGATLAWLEAGQGRSVPPITVPVGDVERHLEDAISVLFDQHAAVLPVCASGTPAGASFACRPPEMSPAAYAAIVKPAVMAIVDESFGLIPGELDLSAVVTMSPRTFSKPLTFLAQVRRWVQLGDRLLIRAGIACLLALALLWLFCAVTIQRPLLWVGTALWVAGAGAWTASWTLSVLGATSIPMRLASRVLADPTHPVAVLGVRMLGGLARAVHARISRVELLIAGVGLLVAVVRLAIPGGIRRRTWLGAARVAVVAMALGALLWAQYLALGQRTSDRAGKAHRAGEVVEALSLYRALDRAYPFAVGDLMWQGLQECERYQAAVAAYEAADYASAVRQFEALLVGNPVIAVREPAESTLVASLTAWAASLRQAGERERALDRYRYVRDAFRERDVQQRIAELYLDWGDALLAQGDYSGGIATYGRITYDVSHPRLWRDADEQRIGAYCAWQRSLRFAGDIEGAQRVCAELLAVYPAATEECGACRP